MDLFIKKPKRKIMKNEKFINLQKNIFKRLIIIKIVKGEKK